MNSQQLAVISVLLLTILCLCGCEGLRYAATEAQKQNAWLHREVCAAAADASIDEEASPELQYSQSGTGFGPVNHGQDDRAILGAVAMQARADSLRKPDVFELADGAIELGIAIAGLVGGVYGLRIAGYLKQAKEKSKALKEIVEGNELFKQLWPEQADRFKEAQQKQSPATKQIVTELKTG
ncbi:MAG: hypothetical protein ACYSOF_01210 [Planctomycetota bacterium]